MSSIDNLAVNDIVSLRLIPALIYGAEHTNLTFMGEISSEITNAYGVVAAEEHQKVYNQLPDGVPDDPKAYPWLVFKRLSGDFLVIGKPWIEEGSLTIEGETTVWVVEIPGTYITSERIRSALNSIGEYNFTISQK